MITPGIAKLIRLARERKASDIHVCAGAPILLRVGRELLPASEGVVTAETAERIAMDMLSPAQAEQFRQTLDYDLMIADDSGRYRVNISYNDRAVGAVIRILPDEARTLEELGLPPAVRQLAGMTKGLVLITGSTSQGKTTTMSAIIHEINITQRKHIVTIEDPIENVHVNHMSVVRQREVGRDTKSFYSGLRAALRQDPDVVAIGEMRDYETIKIALTAAETGVLVLSTLHVISIDKLLERLLSYAPAEDQGHVRNLVAGALDGVIHQELLPTLAGGKRVACEVLMVTDAVRNIIRNRDSFHLRNVIHTGGRHGMVTMKQSVNAMVEQGVIDPAVAATVLVNY
jgi:twitching motility protein PilT